MFYEGSAGEEGAMELRSGIRSEESDKGGAWASPSLTNLDAVSDSYCWLISQVRIFAMLTISVSYL
jgi:hypothetical protein